VGGGAGGRHPSARFAGGGKGRRSARCRLGGRRGVQVFTRGQQVKSAGETLLNSACSSLQRWRPRKDKHGSRVPYCEDREKSSKKTSRGRLSSLFSFLGGALFFVFLAVIGLEPSARKFSLATPAVSE